MAVARSMRRTSPITILLAAILAFGFICFVISPSSPATPEPATSQQRQENAACLLYTSDAADEMD